ncbi:MAG: iron donor protein CyaY [Nannocystaceae bacterium]|nr:iron donor protein CyaY [bacterium]
MERAQFIKAATSALEHIEDGLVNLEHETLDVDLAGDVLTLEFADGTQFVINAHSAAGQVWMAANRSAWHFDYQEDSETWVAAKTDDELMATVSKAVGEKLGIDVAL